MNFTIVELTELRGNECGIYSILEDGETITLFEKFLLEHNQQYEDAVRNITTRLKYIGVKGAREQFFKLNEGKPGDGVVCLYDDPKKRLRLFCIRYANSLVVLCGGAPKSKEIRAWQDCPILYEHGNNAIKISKEITKRIKATEIAFEDDYKFITGDLKFISNEAE